MITDEGGSGEKEVEEDSKRCRQNMHIWSCRRKSTCKKRKNKKDMKAEQWQQDREEELHDGQNKARKVASEEYVEKNIVAWRFTSMQGRNMIRRSGELL